MLSADLFQNQTENTTRGHGQGSCRCGGGSGRFCQGEGGCQFGRSNYTTSELLHMLESTHEIPSISGAEWDLVALHHAAVYPGLRRAGYQLKKKFNMICRAMNPTGNLNIPDTVYKVKEIHELMVEKTDGATGLEEEVFSPDDVEDAEGLFN